MEKTLNRSLLLITGQDATTFLQGLVTNDINLLNNNKQIIYTAMLTSKGKYVLDFFVIAYNNGYLIDICNTQVGELNKKINFYKLISKITVTPVTNLLVYVSNVAITPNSISNATPDSAEIFCLADPRLAELGFRVYSTVNLNNNPNTLTAEQYNLQRYKLAVLQGSEIPDLALPIEYGFDELNGISYTKGCYLGQELTNSAKNLLAIRKRLVTFNGSFSHTNITKDMEITNQQQQKVGKVILSNNNIGVALVKMSLVVNQPNTFVCNNTNITLHVANYVSHYTLD